MQGTSTVMKRHEVTYWVWEVDSCRLANMQCRVVTTHVHFGFAFVF